MNIKNNKNNKTLRVKLLSMATVLFVGLMGCFLASCDGELDIQQSYPFTVETMPVPGKVTKGQTVEIRCEMKKEGNYANALYTIRYFQFEGEGTLKMDNGITFLPNDRYLLENEKFRSTTLRDAARRRTSSWWWRTISGMPTSWSLTSTTRM